MISREYGYLNLKGLQEEILFSQNGFRPWHLVTNRDVYDRIRERYRTAPFDSPFTFNIHTVCKKDYKFNSKWSALRIRDYRLHNLCFDCWMGFTWDEREPKEPVTTGPRDDLPF